MLTSETAPTPITCQENEEGDLFFELPDELLETMGWKEDDTINIEVVGDRILLSRAPRSEGELETA